MFFVTRSEDHQRRLLLNCLIIYSYLRSFAYAEMSEISAYLVAQNVGSRLRWPVSLVVMTSGMPAECQGDMHPAKPV